MYKNDPKVLALSYWEGTIELEKDVDMAIQLMKQAGQDGDEKALEILANWYWCLDDKQSAMQTWHTLCNTYCNVESMMILSQFAEKDQDLAYILKYWEMAAELDHPEAILKLASYYQGILENIPDSDSIAFKYTEKSPGSCKKPVKRGYIGILTNISKAIKYYGEND